MTRPLDDARVEELWQEVERDGAQVARDEGREEGGLVMLETSTLTDEQQSIRAHRFTSTRIVKLVQGRSMEVFNEWFGYAPPFRDSNRPKWGRRLERVIIEAAAEEQGWKRIDYPGTVVDPDDDLFATTADFIADDEIAGDAKNRATDQAWKYAEGEAQESEIVQVTVHCGVLKKTRGVVAALLGGNDLRVIPMSFDAELWDGIKEMCRRFKRDHIDTGTPPPLDYSDAASEYLKARFPKDTGPVIEPTPEAAELVARFRALKLIREEAEKSEQEARNRLLAIVGASAGIAGLCTYKANKASTKTDWEQVAKALKAPTDLVAQFTVTKPGFRVLRLAKGE
jgi:predicted phage-related endonuclease